jgi:hypothetical protein
MYSMAKILGKIKKYMRVIEVKFRGRSPLLGWSKAKPLAREASQPSERARI